MGELHLVLDLLGSDGVAADGTRDADPGTIPRAIWIMSRQLAVFEDDAGESTECGFIGHLKALHPRLPPNEGRCHTVRVAYRRQMPGGRNVRNVNPATPWKALQSTPTR
jgi:hypothetical protein